MNIFKKKKELKAGQVWEDLPLYGNPFGDIWWARIIDIKDKWIKCEVWVEKVKDMFPYHVPKTLKEKDFRKRYPTYIKG